MLNVQFFSNNAYFKSNPKGFHKRGIKIQVMRQMSFIFFNARFKICKPVPIKDIL